jgi:CelD/BcsL family acetyltransferase involved in cellulose biosynthesis
MNGTVRTTTDLDVRVACSLAELEEHADAWDRLAHAAPERIPMLSHAWVASLLETSVPAGSPWRCLFAYRGAELVGVLPVLRSRRFGFSHLTGPVGVHTDRAHPLLAAPGAAETLQALTSTLTRLEPGLWMRFHGIRDTSPVHQALPALASRMHLLGLAAEQGSFVDTSGSFEEFQSSLSSSFRRSLRSAMRKAEQEHVLDFEVVSGPDAADDQLLADFFRVEAAGWKGQAGSAIICHPDRVAFYSALARRLARRGWLEWNLARLDGTVVAAHFGVRFGASLVLPKGGYDESFSRFAPGNLLFWDVFSRSFENGTEEVNFLTDMPWMKIWKMRASTYQNVILSPRRHPVATVASALVATEPRRHARELTERHPWLVDGLQRSRAWLRGPAAAPPPPT